MSILKRTLGLALVLLASLSLLLTLFAVVQVWRLRPPVTASLQSGLEVISTTLQTTSEILDIADQSLEAVRNSTTALEKAVNTLAKSIEDTQPLVNALSLLLKDDLPGAITSAQASLKTAQEGAKIIDAVLRVLTTFNPQAYNPATPLHTALGQVSESLNRLPQSLNTMQVSLSNTGGNLNSMKDQLDQIAANIHAINDNLSHSQQRVQQYQETLTALQGRLRQVYARLPLWVTIFAVGVTFVLFWLGVAQVNVLLRGWEMAGMPGLKKG